MGSPAFAAAAAASGKIAAMRGTRASNPDWRPHAPRNETWTHCSSGSLFQIFNVQSLAGGLLRTPLGCLIGLPVSLALLAIGDARLVVARGLRLGGFEAPA